MIIPRYANVGQDCGSAKHGTIRRYHSWGLLTPTSLVSNEKGAERMNEYMTGKEIVNLINKLEEKGISAEEIIEIIKYIETADPKDPGNK